MSFSCIIYVNTCAVFKYTISFVSTLKSMTLDNSYSITHMSKMIRMWLVWECFYEINDILLSQKTSVSDLNLVEESLVSNKRRPVPIIYIFVDESSREDNSLSAGC